MKPPVQVVVPEAVIEELPASVPPDALSVVRWWVWPVDKFNVPPVNVRLVKGVLMAVVKLAVPAEMPSAEATFTIVPLKLAVAPLSVTPPGTLYVPCTLTVPPLKVTAPLPVPVTLEAAVKV